MFAYFKLFVLNLNKITIKILFHYFLFMGDLDSILIAKPVFQKISTKVTKRNI